MIKDFVKKTFEKIEEYREWNARVESEKTKYLELKKKNDSIEAEFSDRDNVLIEREKSIIERERQIEDSIDRTRLKLETSIEEINEQIKLGQIEDSNLSIDIEERKHSIVKINKEIEQINNEKEKADRDLEGVMSKIASMKIKEKLQERKNKELEKEFDRVSDILRNKQAEIKEIGKREEDLKLYEKRIQRYYDEAGIKIKI
jgi:chromosome segregation ATPase